MTYRLLKVIVQPVFVSEDDEGNLIEQIANAITVTSAEWPDFPALLAKQIAEL